MKTTSNAKLVLLALLCAIPSCNAACLGFAVGAGPGIARAYSANREVKKKKEAALFAASEVELDHACNKGEFLIAGLRDYGKKPLCAKCGAGTTFISDGKGGGVET